MLAVRHCKDYRGKGVLHVLDLCHESLGFASEKPLAVTDKDQPWAYPRKRRENF